MIPDLTKRVKKGFLRYGGKKEEILSSKANTLTPSSNKDNVLLLPKVYQAKETPESEVSLSLTNM